jgi:predicted RND superfamily exporter protein
MYTNSFKTRVWLSRFLTTGIGICVMSYIFLMVSTISLINERKEVRVDIRDAQVAISDLEVRYFDLAKSIDKDIIANLGFTHSTVPVFAYTYPENTTVALLR